MIREANTSPAELADTPALVFSCPNTSHGCRPISVNSQPTAVAASGRKGIAITAHSSSRERAEPSAAAGTRPLRSVHSTIRAISAASRPMPIISRKLQYVTGMIGVYEPGP